ncbi:hypothetical protein JXB31_04610 [Candidatus Woesearchaeota archaeon]|nr:hypothetical protein [Candidatus Woesearchaeota archaeon]
MLEKRAQITLFIVVGIVVLFVVAAGIAVYNSTLIKDEMPILERTATFEKKSSTVRTYTEECLSEVGKEAIVVTGLSGGYYFLPKNTFSLGYTSVPYYYYKEDISQVLSKQEIMQNIGGYIGDNIGYCLDDYSSFAAKGYNITAGDAEVRVTGGNSKIKVELSMPVYIEKDGISSKEDHFSSEFDLRLDDIYLIVNEMITNTIVDPYNIYYSLILEKMDEHEMQIDTLTYSGDTLIYVLQDNLSMIDDMPFVFMFGVKINTTNHPPELEIADLRAMVGENFTYRIDAYDREGDVLEYSTDSDFFGINIWTGAIGFVPREEDIGVHDVVFNVTDGIDTVSRRIRFSVE